jgi:hypothetical protein
MKRFPLTAAVFFGDVLYAAAAERTEATAGKQTKFFEIV